MSIPTPPLQDFRPDTAKPLEERQVEALESLANSAWLISFLLAAITLINLFHK